jgi:anti-anti-sigma factor
MTIEESVEGTVTILTIREKRLMYPFASECSSRMTRLLQEGKLRLVVDLADVGYVDSAINNMFMDILRQFISQGGNIVVCNLTKRVESMWTMVGVLNFLQKYDSVDQGVGSFRTPRLEVSCPVCRPPSWTAWFGRWHTATCSVCDGVFAPHIEAAAWDRLMTSREQRCEYGEGSVQHIWWPTYSSSGSAVEKVQLTLPWATLAVTGRLDRFTLDVVEMAWAALPLPRCVLFDLSNVSYSSSVARTQLEYLCGSLDEESKAVLLIPASDLPLWRPSIAYTDWKSADSALGPRNPVLSLPSAIRFPV